LGEKLIPTQVDTLVGGKHFWRFDKNTDSDLTNPVFLPKKPGFKHLFHSVQNNVCLDTFSKLVYIQALPKITLNDTIVCGAPSITYQLANPLVKTYFLNNVQTKPEIRISQSGIYNIRFESAGCKVDKTIKVKIVNFDKPIVVPDTSNCFGISFRLGFNPLFSNILFDEIPTQDSITISDSNKHFYEATYSLDKDCVVKGEIKLSFKKCDEKPDIIFAPNAFSPNFDGINDVFQVYSNSEFEIQLLQIFDRWGSLIFETQQSPQQWNGDTRGKPAQIGVFVYQIRYRDLKTGDIKYKKGDFMLER
jgi:gliding motility-associated-like protein